MPESITLDVASVDDLDRLHEIEKQCFTIEVYSKQTLRSLLTSPSTIFLKATTKGRIVGFTIGEIRRSEGSCLGEIVSIDVAPRFRRMGVATLLLKRLEDEFRRRGCWTNRLQVRVDNMTAINLFRKLGYHEKKKLTSYYANGVDAFLMEKASKEK